MIALVTGGAGFIGSHLVYELVKRKYKVIVVDNLSTGSLKNLKLVRKKIKFINHDLSKIKKLKNILKDADYIFHLAGMSQAVDSIKKPKTYYKNNVIGTMNVLKSIQNYKIKKFIYSASASCYGNPKKFPTSEREKIQTLTPYALTKWRSEQLIMRHASKYKLPVVSLRLFNVYGPRSKASGAYSAVISVFLKQKLKKKPLTIVGDGTQTRSFVYVSDVIKAMILALKSKVNNGIFNVGSQKSIKIIRLAKLFKGKKIYLPKRPGEPKHSIADISKIKQKLKWKPKISISRGIKILLTSCQRL